MSYILAWRLMKVYTILVHLFEGTLVIGLITESQGFVQDT